jgi:hypothetical protein
MIPITFDNGCWHGKAGNSLKCLSTRQHYPCYFACILQYDFSYANHNPQQHPLGKMFGSISNTEEQEKVEEPNLTHRNDTRKNQPHSLRLTKAINNKKPSSWLNL